MAWDSLARREARVQTKQIGTWAIGVVLLMMFVSQYRRISSPIPEVLGPDAGVMALQAPIGNVVLIGGLVLGHRTIVDERTTGRIKLTAAMPHSRRDIVFGKIVGVATPLAAVVGGLSLVAAILALITYGPPSVLRFVAFSAVSLGYAFICTGIGAMVSASATSSIRATVAMLLTLTAVLLWKQIATRAYVFVTGSQINLLAPPADGVLFLIRRLDPRNAYYLVTNWIYGVGNAPGVYSSVVEKMHPEVDVVLHDVFVVEKTFESPPLYLAEPVGVAILAAWAIIPLYVATRVFRTASFS